MDALLAGLTMAFGTCQTQWKEKEKCYAFADNWVCGSLAFDSMEHEITSHFLCTSSVLLLFASPAHAASLQRPKIVSLRCPVASFIGRMPGHHATSSSSTPKVHSHTLPPDQPLPSLSLSRSIYNVEPYRETFRRVFPNGGIGIVEMLFRTNLLALVGGGRNPRFPPNKVMIWDDHQNRCIGELSFRSEVKAVKLRRDRVVVVLSTKIYVYRFSDLHLQDQMNTLPNPRGLVALCPDNNNTVLACLGINKGSVRVELYDSRKSTLIPAHESELSQIALNLDGTRLATASDKGTLIRIFDTYSGELLQELRRGMDRAEIYSLAFNASSTFVACSSCKGTVHIFALGADGGMNSSSGSGGGGGGGGRQGGVVRSGSLDNVGVGGGGVGGDEVKNTTSGLSFMRNLLPQMTPRYFSSEWSFAQVRGLEAKTVVAFGAREQTLICVGADGSYMVSNFAKGGEAERVSYKKLVKSAEEEDEDHFATTPSSSSGGGLPPPPSSTSLPPPRGNMGTANVNGSDAGPLQAIS